MNDNDVGRSFERHTLLRPEHDYAMRRLLRSRAYVTGTVHPLLLARPLSLLFAAAMADRAFVAEGQRLIHVQQSCSFARPVPVGAEVHAKATVSDISPYSSFISVEIATEISFCESQVFEGSSTFVVLTSTLSHPSFVAPSITDSVLSSERSSVATSRHVTIEDVRQYAAISGDRNPIHTESESARAAGLPGPIVHGMFTLALVGSAAIDVLAGGDATRLTFLSARFRRVVPVGSDIAVEFRSDTTTACARPLVTSAGRRVLRDAVVNLKPEL